MGENTPNQNGLHSIMHQKAVQAFAGLALLMAAGAAGGQIAGFRVEPAECSEARVELAVCAARDELVVEDLEDAEAEVLAMQEQIEELRHRLAICETDKPPEQETE